MAGKQDKTPDAEEEITVVEAPDEVVTGDIDSSKEDEKVKKEVKQTTRRRGNSEDKRIKELWLQRKEAEAIANQQAQRADSERAKNVEYEKITASALEENLNTKRELLTDRLVRAEEAGDLKKKAEITAELSKIEAQAAQIDRYKIENQVRGTQQQPTQPQQVQQQDSASADELYERMSPAGKKWMDDNRDWYDANGENHDPEKASDITYYAQTLENEYRQSGRAAEIGTRGYFKKVDDYIKNNWGDDVNEVDEGSEAQPQKRSYAAPVGNRSVQAQPNGARKEYKISQAEKDMALSLDTKGKDGKPLSDSDKIRRFVSIRESIPPAGPISMTTLRSNKGV